MALPSESQGPDKYRSSLLCPKYHERPPCQEGTLHNCCCCDPCLYIRPNPGLELWFLHEDPPLPTSECFRCAPRALFFHFTPTVDEYEDCCYQASELVHATIDITNGFVSAVYQATFMGVAITVQVGRFPDPGDSSDFSEYHQGYCAWKITCEQNDYETQEYELEIEETGDGEGLQVPTVSLGPFEGPNGCVGDVTFAHFMKEKLAYVDRREITGQDIEKFIQLYPEDDYGTCTEVCSRVCVSGNWRGEWGENKWEFLEFEWFDVAGEQGWSYTDPVTEHTERLLLVQNGDSWVLETDFHDRDFPNVTISTGCSCALWESSEFVLGDESYWYQVHCGWCTCMDFYCGSCRCVPSTLCVQYILGDTFYGPYVLEWDEDNKQWGDDYTDTVTIHLEAGNTSDRECRMIVYYEGEALSLYDLDDDECEEASLQYRVLDCKQEMLPYAIDGVRQAQRLKCMDSDIDFGAQSHEGYYTCADDFIYVYASWFLDDCVWHPCDSYIHATCPEECIDDPKVLHATVTGVCADYDPEVGPNVSKWSLDFVLHLLWEYQDGALFCNYVGYRVVSCSRDGCSYAEVWRLQVTESGWSLKIWYFECTGGLLTARTSTTVFTDEDVTVSCNPFYVESDWMEVRDDEDTSFIAPVYCAGNLEDCLGTCIGDINPSPCATVVKLIATL